MLPPQQFLGSNIPPDPDQRHVYLGIVYMSNYSYYFWLPRGKGRTLLLVDLRFFFKSNILTSELLSGDSESFAVLLPLWYNTIYQSDDSFLRPSVFFLYSSQ